MFKINRYITIFIAKLSARLVGKDEFGNLYYEHNKNLTSVGKKKRFCIYNGTPESSRVPAVFHSWLHYAVDNINIGKFLPTHKWLKQHTINMTGTSMAQKPSKSKVKQQYYKVWKPK